MPETELYVLYALLVCNLIQTIRKGRVEISVFILQMKIFDAQVN